MLLRKLQIPFFILLFPLFFVLHGFTENFYFVSVKSALFLIGIYMISSVVLAAFFYIFYRKWQHAAVLAAFVMAFIFFFGFIHDFIKTNLGNTILVKYSFLLAVFLLVTIILFYVLKKRKQLNRLTSYLNVLFILLLIIDIFTLTGKSISNKSTASLLPKGIHACDNCQKPDIYIILLDGYAGNTQLNAVFSYTNTAFFDSLSRRGFRTIDHSNSNYDSSPSSVASMLNMEYLDSSETKHMRKKGHTPAFSRISNNRLMSFLQVTGYDVFNHSIFKVAGQAAPIGGSFIPSNARLINGNTLPARLEKYVFRNLATRWNLKRYMRKYLYAAHRDNDRLYDLTMQTASARSAKPKIVYTHLMMPHHPYYFNENGDQRSFEELNRLPISDTAAYLSYLKYTNKKILLLVDKIISASPNPPIVAIVSDHGFRYFSTGNYTDHAFSNLMSIHLPGRNYTKFSDTMTSVNFFSTMLNSVFGQQLPMQKDTSYVIDF